MKKAIIIFTFLPVFIFAGHKNILKLKYGKLTIKVNIKNWTFRKKARIRNGRAFIIAGPKINSHKYRLSVTPSIGIVIEKLRNKPNPIIYFTIKRNMLGIRKNIIKMYSNSDHFITMPNSMGCLGKIKPNPNVILNRLVVTSVYGKYGIFIICDSVEDTYKRVEKDIHNILKSIKLVS